LPQYANVTFTCRVTNTGGTGASNVVVKYVIPQGIAYNSNTTSKGTYDSWLGLWTVGTLAPNETATLSLILFTLSTTTSQFAQVWTASPTDVNSTPGNNSVGIPTEDDEALLSIPSVSPVKLINLAVTESASANTVIVGQQLIFTVRVDNTGDTTATNVTIKSLVPAGVTFVSATPQQGTYTASTGIWNIGNIPNASFRLLTVTCTVASIANNIVSFSQVQTATQLDINSTPGNNTNNVPSEDDEASVTVFPQGSSATCNLSLTMSSLPTYTAYTNHDFTLVLRNTGSLAASNVSVDFPFPPHFNWGGSSTATAGTSYDAYFHRWTVGTLASGATVTMTMTLFNVGLFGPVTAFAQVQTASPVDANSTPGNNTTGIAVEDDEANFTITQANGGIGFVAAGQKQTLPVVVNKLYPNPTDGEFLVELNSRDERDVYFEWFTPAGSPMRSEKRHLEKGENRLFFDLLDLPTGIYFLQVSSNEMKLSPLKLVKISGL
jgi:large repetitive protein